MKTDIEEVTHKEIEEVVDESNKRLMAFEHEPSYWNGMMVYEEGDIEGYHAWLRTTLTTLLENERKRVIEMVEEMRKDIPRQAQYADLETQYTGYNQALDDIITQLKTLDT